MVAPAEVIVAPNPSPLTGLGTNTYLLIGDREIAIVDPGPDIDEHIAATLAAANRIGRPISGSLVTHGHRDHLPAAFRLRAATGAPVFAHPAIRDVDRPVREGDEARIGAHLVIVYETPGHSDDHLCFWLDAERLLFAGDLVAGSGTIVLSETAGSLTQYLASLEKMKELGPHTLCPGHGPVVVDGQAKIEEYVAHRAKRERQIVAALREGASTIEAIVQRLYVDTEPALLLLARRNVQAHLDRLVEQGRVTNQDEAWRLA